ncbi:LOW QUALITY PROTEIN: reverse transcriptase [Phytophthora megakarya]|uniref:Reverse transcriptase n=1 Tax=Phytophthora megakarya TaxID=4795 RepID=A0A225VUC6_9STRA|nr:LOW QUALITY PROTEIN: reverse transcriptase [Phytophthora megakarya]
MAATIVIAASAYLKQTTVNIVEYSGMNHGVIAALEHGAEDLVIVGDSRLAIQQSLGVIACHKDSLITLLNRHRELVAKLKSYNAATDSLAGEALESKVSKVVLNDHRKTELKELNRIQEMIYGPTSDDIKVENASSETFSQILDGKTRYIHAIDSDILLQRKTYAAFAHQERAEVSATTRSQTETTKKRVHFEDEVPEVTINTETTEAVNETRKRKYNDLVLHEPTGDGIEPVTVQEERRRRIVKVQDEELRWSNLKAVLRGETTAMTYKEAREAWKWADNFVLSRDNVLYYTGVSRRKVDETQPEMSLRLVVPTTMIQEVLHNCHDSIEGGHQGVVRSYQRVKHDYYWVGLYADVEKHVKSCLDCSSSKSRPQLKGYSPGNVLAERPFQVVSMDFVIPLPRSLPVYRVWIAKAMSNTDALTVAKVFEECIYRRFGAPSLIRTHVFQAFTELIQTRSRSTLSYRPQANGQQERSVKTVMQSIKVYVEDPLQQDWDEIAERLVFTINNSHDMTRKETPF